MYAQYEWLFVVIGVFVDRAQVRVLDLRPAGDDAGVGGGAGGRRLKGIRLQDV